MCLLGVARDPACSGCDPNTRTILHLIALFLSLLACAACSTTHSGSNRPPQPDPIAFNHTAVVDVERGRVLLDQTVVVTGERITAVGPSGSVPIPRKAQVVDARGKYLIPGLWDMHVHLGSTGRSSLALYVANGVTGVRDLGGHFAQVATWRDSIRSRALLGPRIVLAGPIVERAGWLADMRGSARARGDTTPEGLLAERIAVETPEDARRAVDSIAALGADFLKLRNDPAPAALAELLRAARARGLSVAAHIPVPITPERLARLEFASIEHGYIGVTGGRITSALEAATDSTRRAVFQSLAARGVAYTPTLITANAARLTPDSLIRAIAQDTAGRLDPRRRYLAPALAREWLRELATRDSESPIDWLALYTGWARDLTAARDAGVLLLAGSDPGAPMVFPGFSLHDELMALVQDGGLLPVDALRAATLNPARFLGSTDSLGAVEPGKLADLVLLDANPLENINNTRQIRAVVRNGRYLDRAALDRLLSETEAVVKAQP